MVYFISLYISYLQLYIHWICSACFLYQGFTNWGTPGAIWRLSRRYVGTDSFKTINSRSSTSILPITYLSGNVPAGKVSWQPLPHFLFPSFTITLSHVTKEIQNHSLILSSAFPWNINAPPHVISVNPPLIKVLW